MFGKTYPEVLVMGAGPVGLCAALALARRDVRVSIVDKEWRSGAHSYALAYCMLAHWICCRSWAFATAC